MVIINLPGFHWPQPLLWDGLHKIKMLQRPDLFLGSVSIVVIIEPAGPLTHVHLDQATRWCSLSVTSESSFRFILTTVSLDFKERLILANYLNEYFTRFEIRGSTNINASAWKQNGMRDNGNH